MSYSTSFVTTNPTIQRFLSLLGRLAHSDLVRQNEYLKAENRVLRKRLTKRLRLKPNERAYLVRFGKPIGSGLQEIVSIVKYKTFLTWIRASKTRISSPAKGVRGRPKTLKAIRKLVVKLARENAWGYVRILGELKKLGINRLSKNSIKNILKENHIDPAPERAKDSWDDFIKRHFQTLWACDFFTEQVLTPLGPVFIDYFP